MEKFRNVLTVFLLIAVVLLGAAVFRLYQADDSPSVSASDPSAPSVTDAGTDTDESKAPAQEEATTAELRCTVELGALKVIRGEAFGISEGSTSDCETSLEDGVYTVSVSAAHGAPVVVTVPEDMYFTTSDLTVSGGNLTVEELDVEDLSATCEQGSLQFSGRVDGDVEVEHLQGETALQLEGSASDFNHEISYEMGHVQVGAQSYSGAKGSQSVDNGAEKTLRVHCTMGDVGVVFADAS